MPGLVEFFATLRRLDMGFALATNNASKTAVMYTEKLARFGVHVPGANRHLVGSHGRLLYAKNTPTAQRIYVVGAKGLHDAV
jgi:4-nitrophenyl phosphatase